MNVAEDDFTTRLRAYVRRRVPSSSDADDVVQSVLLKLLESGSSESAAPPRPWLLAVARSAIADLHRSRARTAESLEQPAAVPQADPDDASDITHCLMPVLARLSEEDQLLLRRVDLEGGSQAELARELGVTASVVKSRVQRARERLRDAVIARCAFERDARGSPIGPAACRPASSNDCGCGSEASDRADCG